MSCCDKTQTYVGENGDLFVGDIDTTVYAENSYLVCSIPNNNYNSNLTFNQILSYGNDAVLENPTTITLSAGKKYEIIFNGNIEPVASLPIVIKILINGVESKIWSTTTNALVNFTYNCTLITYYDSSSGDVELTLVNSSSNPFYQLGSITVKTLGNS